MAQATVSIKLGNDYSNVRLAVSLNSDLTNPIYSNVYSTTNRMIKITMSDLMVDTKYYYGVVINGDLQDKGRGSFRTLPTGASNFTVAFSSCAFTGSEHAVFSVIKDLNPNMFIHMGDLHYSDITSNDIELYRNAYTNVLKSSVQSALYSNIPLAYVWDDHDYGNNNSDGTSPSKQAAALAYREFVPHYDLPSGNSVSNPIFQSFVIGRVRFIITDLRYNKAVRTNTDNSDKTMMSETQIQWFFNELLKSEPLKIWVNSKPWIGTASGSDDSWRGYTTERRRIANFIKQNGLQKNRMAIISGDMHGLAIDDGANSDYADDGGAAIPVFQAAQLDQNPSTKGGPWSSGSFTSADSGQFGIMNITDDGINPITVEWIGRRLETVLTTHSFTVPSALFEPSEPIEPTPPPLDITNLQVSSRTERSITLSWDASLSNNITHYVIFKNGLKVDETTSLTYTIIDLSPGTSYEFIIKTQNVNSDMSNGVSIQASTAEEEQLNDLPTEDMILRVDAKRPEEISFVESSSIFNAISKVNDLSGNANHLQPGTVAITSTALYIDSSNSAAYGNQPYFKIEQGKGKLNKAPLNNSFNNEMTVFFVGSLTSVSGASQRLFDFDKVGGESTIGIHKGSSSALYIQLNGSSNSSQVSILELPDELNLFTLTLKNGVLKFYKNQDKIIEYTAPSSFSFSGDFNFRLGYRHNSTQELYANIGETVIYKRALEDLELERAINFLKNKWNII